MILAVTGLQRERRILAGAGVEVVLGGDDIAARAAGKHGVISIGLAGALATLGRARSKPAAPKAHKADQVP